MPATIVNERQLLALCHGLGAKPAAGRDTQGHGSQLVPTRSLVARIADAIRRGEDPLGDAFCRLRSGAQRRVRGATYTPQAIVTAMVDWVGRIGTPVRIVDPGAGSGRFLLAAGRAFPAAHLIGVEIDPLAAAMTRANLAAAGLADRAEVVVADYRSLRLRPVDGPTLFIGNPPYVRHHDIEPTWKAWLTHTARAHGLPVSQLAGLHLHFLVATLAQARAGDYGTLITASEWLDVNYGARARALLSGPLGLVRIDLIAPTVSPFADATTTGVITGFRIGSRGPVRVRRVGELAALTPLVGGRLVSHARLRETARWTTLSRPQRARASDLVELGELCRVHRGQVTGCNRVWIAGAHTPSVPSSVLRPAITRAKELFLAGRALSTDATLRRVIDLPDELAEMAAAERPLVEAFLRWAREHDAHGSYIARHRSPWWSVKLRAPAPILATYMARRPPAFVRNLVGARHVNIAHGLYPREVLSTHCLDALARYLARKTSLGDGRVYAGGLTKFEPREMERLLVPTPQALAHEA
jgi:hypothetical protein